MWTYAFVLIWVAYVLTTGIHIFSRGFLLSRQTVLDVTDWPEMQLCKDTKNVSISVYFDVLLRRYLKCVFVSAYLSYGRTYKRNVPSRS